MLSTGLTNKVVYDSPVLLVLQASMGSFAMVLLSRQYSRRQKEELWLVLKLVADGCGGLLRALAVDTLGQRLCTQECKVHFCISWVCCSREFSFEPSISKIGFSNASRIHKEKTCPCAR